MKSRSFVLLITMLIFCSLEPAVSDKKGDTTKTTYNIADTSLWLYRSFEQFYKSNIDTIIPYLRQYIKGIKNQYSVVSIQHLKSPNNAYLRTPEALFVDQRQQRSANSDSFKKFIDYAAGCMENTKPLPIFKKIPRIAFCGSGGGYRAMIFNSGYMAGLQHIFLNDSVLFTCSLSGSTWYMAPWMTSKKTEIDYQSSLAHKIQEGTFSLISSKLKDFDFTNFFESVIWPKILFEQPIDFIDIYGGLLSYILFYDKGKNCFKQYMSDQLNELTDYEKPFPLYTAVSMYKNNNNEALYQWYEFNPFNVVNLDLSMTLPIYAFGSKFDKGKTQQLMTPKGLINSIAPEQSLGYFLGMFGSAISINYADMERIMIQPVLKNTSQSFYEKTKNKIFSFTLNAFKDQLIKLTELISSNYKGQVESVVNVLNNDKTRYIRAAAAQINNPFNAMQDLSTWIAQKETISLIDGGIAYNIPIRPLMRKERELDVIIIGDSSADAQQGNELNAMFNDLTNQGYAYREFFLEDRKTYKIINYKNARFFRDTMLNGPIIIYFNFSVDRSLFESTKDPILSALIEEYKLNDFDVQQCLNNECGTFNFDYTTEQFWRSTKLTELIVRCHAPTILTILAQLFGTNDELEDEIDF